MLEYKGSHVAKSRAHMNILKRLRRRFTSGNWDRWPDRAYQLTSYQDRLRLVQQHLAEAIQSAPPGPIRILSICAGDGRDLIEVLSEHERRADVSAVLIELSPKSVARGIQSAIEAGIENAVAFRNTDATRWSAYRGLIPADIVILCGVWGHVPVRQRARLTSALASICAVGGCVIWSRGVSRGMERLPQIQTHFNARSWKVAELRFTPASDWAVATYRFLGAAQPVPDNEQIFNFRPGAGTR